MCAFDSPERGRTEGVGASFAAEFGKRGLDFLIGRDFPACHLCAGLVDRRQFLRRGMIDATRVQFLDTVERDSSTSSSRSSSGSRSHAINQALSLGRRHACHLSHSAFGWAKRSVPARWALRTWACCMGAAFALSTLHLLRHARHHAQEVGEELDALRHAVVADCEVEDGGVAGPVRPIRRAGRWGGRRQATRT